jgi:hypothetical protein
MAGSWLKPFLDHRSQDVATDVSAGPGDRKSVAPMVRSCAAVQLAFSLQVLTAAPANRILVAGSLTFVSNDLRLGGKKRDLGGDARETGGTTLVVAARPFLAGRRCNDLYRFGGCDWKFDRL